MLWKCLLILISYEKPFVFVLLFISSFLKCFLSFDCIPDAGLGSGSTVLSLWRALWSPRLGKKVRAWPGNQKCVKGQIVKYSMLWELYSEGTSLVLWCREQDFLSSSLPILIGMAPGCILLQVKPPQEGQNIPSLEISQTEYPNRTRLIPQL